jgi:hypothetical protein
LGTAGNIEAPSYQSHEALAVSERPQPGRFYGISATLIPDITGDGVSECAVGDPESSAVAGRVAVLSGKDGHHLCTLVGPAGHPGCGDAISGLRSNPKAGNGVVLVGAPPVDDQNPGAAFLVSVPSGAVIAHLTPNENERQFGKWVGCARSSERGELVIVGSDLMYVDAQPGKPVGDPGIASDTVTRTRLSAYSSAGDYMRSWTLSADASKGLYRKSLCLVGDCDGGGTEDIALQRAGEVQLLSLESGAIVWTRRVARALKSYRLGLTQTPDLDGDQLSDIAVTIPPPAEDPIAAVCVLSGKTGAIIRILRPSSRSDVGSIVACVPGGSTCDRWLVTTSPPSAPWNSLGLVSLDDPSRDRRLSVEMDLEGLPGINTGMMVTEPLNETRRLCIIQRYSIGSTGSPRQGVYAVDLDAGVVQWWDTIQQ